MPVAVAPMASVASPWIAAIGGLFSSLGGSGSAKKQAKQDFKNQLKLLNEQGLISRKNTQFEKSLDYYYQQKDKQERMRGLDEFRKFSKVNNYAPTYVNNNPGPQVPAMPNYAA